MKQNNFYVKGCRFDDMNYLRYRERQGEYYVEREIIF